LLAFGAGIGTAAITAGATFATIPAATAARATAAAMAFDTAAIVTTAFTAALASEFAATFAAGAFTFGARGVTTGAISALGATATAAAVAATSALITVATAFAAFAVTFTGVRRGGSGGFETEETFQPGDETAGAFGLRRCRRETVALFGASVAAGLAGFKALTFTTGLTSGISTGLGVHGVKFLGGIFLAARLAGAGLDAERRAIFAARARVARRRFPAGGWALGFGGR
jgi:hypothetical protein